MANSGYARMFADSCLVAGFLCGRALMDVILDCTSYLLCQYASCLLLSASRCDEHLRGLQLHFRRIGA